MKAINISSKLCMALLTNVITLLSRPKTCPREGIMSALYGDLVWFGSLKGLPPRIIHIHVLFTRYIVDK